MSIRPLYDVLGVLLGAVAGVLGNLVAAGIQQRAFPGAFSTESIAIMIALMIVCFLVAHWLGGPKQVVVSDSDPQTVTVTRFRAWFSPTILRGAGIHIRDSAAFGSKIDIDTRD